MPALAGHCPKDVKLINAAMSSMAEGKMSMAKEAATTIAQARQAEPAKV